MKALKSLIFFALLISQVAFCQSSGLPSISIGQTNSPQRVSLRDSILLSSYCPQLPPNTSVVGCSGVIIIMQGQSIDVAGFVGDSLPLSISNACASGICIFRDIKIETASGNRGILTGASTAKTAHLQLPSDPQYIYLRDIYDVRNDPAVFGAQVLEFKITATAEDGTEQVFVFAADRFDRNQLPATATQYKFEVTTEFAGEKHKIVPFNRNDI